MKQLLTFLICIVYAFNLYAQISEPYELEWGKIKKEDKLIQLKELYPEANAVVLGEIGKYEILLDNEGKLLSPNISRHVRMMILNEEGLTYAKGQFSFLSKNKNDVLSTFKAQAYLSNGETLKIKKKDLEIKEKNGWSTAYFEFPNIDVGTIVEYVYKVKQSSKDYLPMWLFQGDIPKKYSQITTVMPENMVKIFPMEEYAEGLIVFKNKEGLSVKLDQKAKVAIVVSGEVNSRVVRNPVSDRYRYLPRVTGDGNDKGFNSSTYILEDISGGRSVNNSPKLIFRSSLAIEGEDWDVLGDDLVSSEIVQSYLNADDNRNLIKTFLDGESGDKNVKESIDAVKEFINTKLIWNGTYHSIPQVKLNNALEKEKVGSAAINMLGILLLREMGVNCELVFISTRSNGVVRDLPLRFYRKSNPFNHVMIRIKDTPVQFFDFSSKDRMTEEVLTHYGFSIDKEGRSNWVVITDEPSQVVRIVKGVLTKDGAFNGDLQYIGDARDAKGIKKQYEKFKDDLTSCTSTFFNHDEVRITALEGEEIKQDKFKCSIEFGIDDFMTKDEVSFEIKPFNHVRWTGVIEDIQKMIEYNSEFIPYPIKEKSILNVELPKGYTVISLPESLSIATKDGKTKFTYNTSLKGQRLQVICKLDVGKYYFSIEEQKELNQLLKLINQKIAEGILLVEE